MFIALIFALLLLTIVEPVRQASFGSRRENSLTSDPFNDYYMLIGAAAVIVFVSLTILARSTLSSRNKTGKSKTIPPAFLQDVKKAFFSEPILIGKNHMTVGREKSNDITLPVNTISKLQATIEYCDDRYVLTDHRSANKSYLNNKVLSPNVPVNLKHNDLIKFDIFEFRFIQEGEATQIRAPCLAKAVNNEFISTETNANPPLMQLFISHAEEDGDIAIRLAQTLEGHHYTTWYYERDGLPGMNFVIQTMQAVESCQAIILIISAHSLSSQHVGTEIFQAYDRQITIIPLLHGISYDDFKKQKSDWCTMLGSRVAIPITDADFDQIVSKIIKSLSLHGISAGATSE